MVRDASEANAVSVSIAQSASAEMRTFVCI